MTIFRATIWAWIGQKFSLQWCCKYIALEMEGNTYNTVENLKLQGTFKCCSAMTTRGAFVEQRLSNSEAVGNSYKLPKRQQYFHTQAAPEREIQTFDQHERRDR